MKRIIILIFTKINDYKKLGLFVTLGKYVKNWASKACSTSSNVIPFKSDGESNHIAEVNMKIDIEIVKALNEVLTGQLSAINQYFLHARMLSDWGYEKVAKVVYKESITQMKLAEKTTDRILLIEGLPNYQKLLKINIGEETEEVLANDKAYCLSAVERLREVAKLCLEKKDHVSRELIEVFDERRSHLLWLDKQLDIISEVGIKNYLAEQI